MKMFDADDPRLTAYVLGELDRAEASSLEEQMAADANLRREVQEIRAMVGTVSGSLATEPVMKLTPRQRDAVTRAPRAVLNSPAIFRTTPRWIAAGAALAACIALAFTAAIYFRSEPDQFSMQPTAKENLANRARGEVERLTTLESASTKEVQFGADSKGKSGHMDPMTRTGQAVGSRGGGGGKLEAKGDKDHSELAQNAAAGIEGSGEGFSNGRMPTAAPGATADPRADERRQYDLRSRVAPPPPPQSREQGEAAPRPAAVPAPVSAKPAEPAAPRERAPDQGLTSQGRSTGQDSGPISETTTGEEVGRLGFESLNSKVRRDTGNGLSVIEENPFIRAIDEPISTFSADVDTASYSNVRRSILSGLLPDPNAVRLEEMINYFAYNDAPPSARQGEGSHPFNATIEINACPWEQKHRLVRIGVKAKEVPADMRPATSLVFLIDVSGSMNQPHKLPLVQQSLKMLIDELTADDRIAIVTYAGQAGLKLDSLYLTGENKPRALQVIDELQAGGGTNGAGGIQQAYEVGQRYFIRGGVNRVLLCTDGDFNVGVSGEGDLVRLIQEKRLSGVYLSVLGFGSDDFQEAKIQQLAKHGNGNFAFIDSAEEAHKALIEQMSGTLVTVAKDVKLQADFNPAKVEAYRLVGYENRMLRAEDFRNDLIDAGEIGAGHSVTALYEIIPAGEAVPETARPQSAFVEPGKVIGGDRMLALKIRYKLPEETGNQGIEIGFDAIDEGKPLVQASPDFHFASAVASFGMVLRDSKYKGDATYDSVLKLARTGLHRPEVSKELIEHLDDFRHYALIGRPDLALPHFQVLLTMNVQDVQLAAAVDRLADTGPAFEEGLRRAIAMPALKNAGTSLEERLMRGRQILGNYRENDNQHNHRNEFIELVQKAKAIAGQ